MSGPKTGLTDESTKNLEVLRNTIDAIDDRLLELINERMIIAKDIGILKRKSGGDIQCLQREARILDRLCARNDGPIDNENLVHIFTDIVSAGRIVQQPQRIVYLGPEATFTHIAALEHFGRAPDFVPQQGIRDVFVEVEKGNCQYGVVPVENSIEGSVNYTLDLFFEFDLKICAEKYLTISHDLLSASDRLEQITTVHSHPQPIAQCRRWLRKQLPGVKVAECSSTSAAAKEIASIPGGAAIASSEAARLYGLNVIASRIEDDTKNTTRFLIIGKQPVGRTGEDKTSIMFSAPHVPGALYKVLEPVAKSGLNMLKLESRPSKHENWSYFFFLDLEGHIADPPIQDTIKKMKEICLFVKLLGSYPQTRPAGQTDDRGPVPPTVNSISAE